jgi:hypothetical protein
VVGPTVKEVNTGLSHASVSRWACDSVVLNLTHPTPVADSSAPR